MGAARITIPLERSVVRIVDQLVAKRHYRTREQAIRTAVTSSLEESASRLTITEALAIVRRGRAARRQGKTKHIDSLADLL